jgi:tetratricopeptide (TPR) repeat protein
MTPVRMENRSRQGPFQTRVASETCGLLRDFLRPPIESRLRLNPELRETSLVPAEVAVILRNAVFRSFPIMILLVALSAQTPPDARGLAGSARALMAEQKYAEAARDYKAFLKLRPRDAEARFALGVCYTQMDRLGEAASELRQYVALLPKSAEGRAALGSVLLAQGLSEDARPQLEIALRLDPLQADAAKDLARCYNLSGEPAKAVPVLRPVLSAAPADTEARYLLAAALLNSSDAAAAAQELDRMLAADAGSPADIYNLAARAQQKLGNLPKAIDLCERGMRLYPYAAQLEAVYLGLPPETLAKRIETRLEEISAARTADAGELLALARVIMDWPQTAKQIPGTAEALASRAVVVRPNDPWTRFHYARALGCVRKYDEAVEALESALAMLPDSELQVLIHTRLASLEQMQSHPDQARESFLTAMAINRKLPKPNPDAACEYAKFLREQAQPTEARAVLEEALRWAPFNVPARLERAKFLADDNRGNEVIREATFVVRNSEDEEVLHSAHYLLARAYRMVGDQVHARSEQSWLESQKMRK